MRHEMHKSSHEFRDPVHVFIRLDADERKVVDSVPFQRLRHIHQLAMTYLVYPGATHKRFEHSLGCMELASRIFDTITKPEHLDALPGDVRERLRPKLGKQENLAYWRKTVRMAALCHDLGHLPFSHAAEDLLPDKIDHETMTLRIICEEMSKIWRAMEEPQPKPETVARIAVGPEKATDGSQFSDWERLLSEIITGDVFGADRMDYLLRDSLHAGVGYGLFDHHRLIDTMRILPGTPKDKSQDYDPTPELGIEYGGKEVAESLLVARYLMFSQVYFHPVRRIYDLHLKRFLKQYLQAGVYPTALHEFIKMTDNNVLVFIQDTANDTAQPGHAHAHCIHARKHFKVAFHASRQDIQNDPDIHGIIVEGLSDRYGRENVIGDEYDKKTSIKNDFPIRTNNERIISAYTESPIVTSLPVATTGYVFVNQKYRYDACNWVKNYLRNNLKNSGGEQCSSKKAQA